jgi:hypothetical protein
MPVSSRKKEDNRGVNGNSARVRLRLVEVDVDGGTAELAEGFKSFAAAFTRTTGVPATSRVLAAPKPPATTSTAVSDEPQPEEESITDTSEAEPDATERHEPVANGTDRPKRRTAPKAPRFLSDLDLTKAGVQLADFAQERSPDGDMDKYAVIAVWFKQQLGVDEITIDHIFTAYGALGWQAQLPDDPSQTFRNLKSNKNWVDTGSKRGAYKVNWNGESAVNKMGAAKK